MRNIIVKTHTNILRKPDRISGNPTPNQSQVRIEAVSQPIPILMNPWISPALNESPAPIVLTGSILGTGTVIICLPVIMLTSSPDLVKINTLLSLVPDPCHKLSSVPGLQKYEENLHPIPLRYRHRKYTPMIRGITRGKFRKMRPAKVGIIKDQGIVFAWQLKE